MTTLEERTITSILRTNFKYLKRWLNILCNTEMSYKTFTNDFLDVTDLESSIFEYQNYLKNGGRGQTITLQQIKECIDKMDRTKLKELLEELLLIPVDSKELNKVLKIKDYEELAVFIERIKQYSTMRYAKVIDEYFYYNEAG